MVLLTSPCQLLLFRDMSQASGESFKEELLSPLPLPSPSKEAVLESGKRQPVGIQGSLVTGISPVVQCHLPEVIPALPEPTFSIGGDFWGGFPAFQGGEE